MGRGQAQVADHFSAVFGDRRGTSRSADEPEPISSADSRLVIRDYVFILLQPGDSLNDSPTQASINMYRRGEADIEPKDRVPFERGEYSWWHSHTGTAPRVGTISRGIGGQQFSQKEIDTIHAWVCSHEEGNRDW